MGRIYGLVSSLCGGFAAGSISFGHWRAGAALGVTALLLALWEIQTTIREVVGNENHPSLPNL